MNPTLSPPTRQLNLILTMMLAVCVVVLGVAVFVQGWGGDFNHFYSGARTWLDGGDPYRGFYVYPEVYQYPHEQFHPLPWVLFSFVPLARLPFQVALHVWGLVNLLFMVLSLLAVYRLGRSARSPLRVTLVAWGVFWLSVRCVYMGQTSLLITCAVLWAMVALRQARWLLSGMLFSLILFKPWIAVLTLAGLLLVVWRERHWRFTVGLLIGTTVLLLVPTLLWPGWLSSYLQVDFSQSLGVKINGEFVIYWPVATLFEYVRLVLNWAPTPLETIGLWVSLGFVCVSLGWVTLRAWLRRRIGTQLMMGIGTLLGLLVVPYVRYYDYTILSVWLIGIMFGDPEFQLHDATFKIVSSLIVLGLVLTVNPEPWAYQLLAWLYVASWIGLNQAGWSDAAIQVTGESGNYVGR